MNPVVRAIGKVLRLVGISSPEDSVAKPKAAADPPSWRESLPKKPEERPRRAVTSIKRRRRRRGLQFGHERLVCCRRRHCWRRDYWLVDRLGIAAAGTLSCSD